MQRFVLYSLCAVAVALAVWLVSGSRDSDDPTGGPAEPHADVAATPPPAAGAPAQPGADLSAGDPQDLSAGDPQGEIDAAVRAALGAPQTPGSPAERERRALGESAAQIPEATGSGSETIGRVGATGSAPSVGGFPVIGSTPESIPAGSVPDSQPDPATPGETGETADADVPAPGADDADVGGVPQNAPSGPPEVLSAEEIAERVEEKLPDGSLPPEQLEPAREALAQDILNKSTQAAGWARQ